MDMESAAAPGRGRGGAGRLVEGGVAHCRQVAWTDVAVGSASAGAGRDGAGRLGVGCDALPAKRLGFRRVAWTYVAAWLAGARWGRGRGSAGAWWRGLGAGRTRACMEVVGRAH